MTILQTPDNTSKFQSISEPTYSHREYKNDFGGIDPTHQHKTPTNLWLRTSQVALPFLSLYKPVGQTLTLALGITRTANSLFYLKTAINNKGNKEISSWGLGRSVE